MKSDHPFKSLIIEQAKYMNIFSSKYSNCLYLEKLRVTQSTYNYENCIRSWIMGLVQSVLFQLIGRSILVQQFYSRLFISCHIKKAYSCNKTTLSLLTSDLIESIQICLSMEWYYMVELIVVATFIGITVVGGSFVIVTQIRKPYVASSKVCTKLNYE